MNTKTIFIILFLLALVLIVAVGCKKAQTSGPSSVYGQAVDQTTGKGVPYAIVSLIGQNSNIIGAMGQQALQTVNADVNGKFYFSFNYESGNDYNVYATAPGYFNDGNAITQLNAGQNNNIKIDMNPEGWVRFYLVNVPPLDTLDFFGIGDFNNSPNLSTLYKNTSFVVYGNGNTFTHFGYSMIYKNGVQHQYYDTIYVKALDTVNYTINY